MIPPVSDIESQISRSVPVVGFLGRFDPCKGLDVLISACAELKTRGVAFRLDVGGDGAQREEMRSLARRFGITDSIRWLGWVSDKRTFFGGIDVFVMPSREEAVGLSMLEAMSHQRAVVLSDCPGPAGIAGDCGLIVPREDVGALAVALERVLTSPKIRSDLATRGRLLVERDYSEAGLRERLMRLLTALGTRGVVGRK